MAGVFAQTPRKGQTLDRRATTLVNGYSEAARLAPRMVAAVVKALSLAHATAWAGGTGSSGIHSRVRAPRALAAAWALALSTATPAVLAQSPPPPGYGATPANEPPLQAGGLTPPPTTPAGQQETLRELQRAEHEDSGRGLEFIWLNAEAGYEYITLQGLKSGGLLDGEIIPDEGSAFTFGVGAGVRLIFLTLGARFRLAQASAWNLWTLDAEAGLHFPLGVLEPYVVLGAGYASLGGVDDPDDRLGFAASEIEASGFNVRLGGGLDWYLNPLLSLGVQGNVELLSLSRSGSSAAGALTTVYAEDGDGIGLGVTLTGVVGVHL
jgi:hypothetical protein